PQCHAELHVCRMCIEYDTRVAKHRREPTAEEVNDKTHASFCDHFKPRAAAFTPPNTAEVETVRTELERLSAKRWGALTPRRREPASCRTRRRSELSSLHNERL